MTQTFGQSICKSRLSSSRGPCLWPWKICSLLNAVIHCVMHAFAVVLINLNCGDSGRGIMFTSNMRGLRHWMSWWSALSLGEEGVVEWFVVVGMQGMECREYSKNYIPCHPIIESTIHHELAVLIEDLPYFVCREKKWVATMLLCYLCQRGWHMPCPGPCLRPPLTSLPSGQWSCHHCWGSLVLGVSTSRTQWSCVIFTMLCMPKWKWRIMV